MNKKEHMDLAIKELERTHKDKKRDEVKPRKRKEYESGQEMMQADSDQWFESQEWKHHE